MIFIFRRFAIIAFAFFVKEGIVQLTAIGSLSVCVLFYVGFTWCFKNVLSNLYVILNEGIYLIIVFLLFRHLMFEPDDTFTYINRTATSAWALNIIYGISLIASKVLRKFHKNKSAKVANMVGITSVEKINVDSGWFKNFTSSTNTI